MLLLSIDGVVKVVEEEIKLLSLFHEPNESLYILLFLFLIDWKFFFLGIREIEPRRSDDK